jgi:hypothetical protein
MNNEIKAIIKFPNKISRMDDFTAESNQTFKEELAPRLFRLSHEMEKEEILPNSSYETRIATIPKLVEDTMMRKL